MNVSAIPDVPVESGLSLFMSHFLAHPVLIGLLSVGLLISVCFFVYRIFSNADTYAQNFFWNIAVHGAVFMVTFLVLFVLSAVEITVWEKLIP